MPEQEKKSGTYEAGCHCGYIKFSITLSPPLPEYEVLDCNCSMCAKAGYLLVCKCPCKVQLEHYKESNTPLPDPHRQDVKWHGDSRSRCAVYRFNTKQKDQLFCPKCGTSLGIDFRESMKPRFDGYGISVSSLTQPLSLGRFMGKELKRKSARSAPSTASTSAT
jgi:hypothetical protein